MGLLGCTNQGLTFSWSFLFFSTLGNEGYGAIQWQGCGWGEEEEWKQSQIAWRIF